MGAGGAIAATGAAASLLTLVVACARPAPVDPCAAERAFAPWDQAEAGAHAARAEAGAGPAADGAADGAADALVAAYQRRLRRPELPGGGCRFHPTCSAFAREALDRYGVLGLLLAFDRLLIREQPFAGPSYPPACVGGAPRWHDPVP